MMKYVEEDALYDIMAACQSNIPQAERLSSKEAMMKLNQLIQRIKLHGRWRFENGELTYHPNFQAIADNINTTSSIISMPDGESNRKSRVEIEVNEFEVEVEVAGKIVGFFNRSFADYGKPEWAELYYFKHIYGMKVEHIKARTGWSNKLLYKNLGLAEYVVTYGFCLHPVDRVYNMYIDLVKRYREKYGLPMHY